MLEKLNDIDWKSRNAADVPIWLQNLSSSDDKIRINAQQQLDETVVRITDQIMTQVVASLQFL